MVQSKVKKVELDGNTVGKAEVFVIGDAGAPDNERVYIGVDFVLKTIKSRDKFTRDAQALRRHPIDPSLQAFILGADGKVVSEAGFVYYGQTVFGQGVVELSGPRDLTRHNSQMRLNLNALAGESNRIRLVASLDKGVERQHHMGMLLCAVLLVYRNTVEQPIAINAFSDFGWRQQSVVLGDICLTDGKWQFEPNGVCSEGALAELCDQYGVEIREDDEAAVTGE